jgi:hypothetical protein
MSTDKLQALRNAFTEIVSEPPLSAISFDEEAATATLFSAANTAEPGELAVGDSPTSPKHLATPADQAKSFAGLGIDMIRKTLSEILNEPSSPPSFFDKESAPAPLADEPNMEEPALEAAVVDPPTDTEAAVRSAKQAKSLLAGLGIDAAIRLRWAMRDIRANRTTISPLAESDLAALVDLGFVAMREGRPSLTDVAVLALD